VHIAEIDADHRNLFALADRIHEHVVSGAGHGAILLALGHLVSYVQEHFDREERLMERVAYPDIAEHKKIHQMLQQIVHSMHRIYTTDPNAVDPQKLLEFLRDWLQNHIVKSDLLYEPWVNNRLGQASGDIAWSEADDPAEAEPTKVEISVPAEKAWILHECARLIRENDWRAEVIEETAARSTEENLESDKAVANVILR
jgi:hemerythrin-like metal-binding protein